MKLANKIGKDVDNFIKNSHSLGLSLLGEKKAGL